MADKHEKAKFQSQVQQEKGKALVDKLEMKVRKKFNEEVDKLEKSFRRIMD